MSRPARDALPVPALAFRVGVIGHRLGGLERCGADIAMLRVRVDEILSEVRAAVTAVHREESAPYSADPPMLRCLSSLAEGSDRVGAAAALDAGFELQVILPFRQEAYERDFEGHSSPSGRTSVEEFRVLLGAATAVMDLDADPALRGRYAPAAISVVRQSDLLVAIWDGEAAEGPGGTAESVAEAARLGLPVIWIDAVGWNRHPMGMTRAEAGGLVRDRWSASDLHRRIRDQLLLSERHSPGHGGALASEPPAEALEAFLRTPVPKEPAIPVFSYARGLLALGADERTMQAELGVDDALVRRDAAEPPVPPTADRFEHDLLVDVPAAERTPALQRLVALVRPVFGDAFLRADLLALRYGARYRNNMTWAFVAAFGASLSALAMLLRLGAHGEGDSSPAPWFAIAEVVLLAWIWYLYRAMTRRRLHQRWVDYRSLAEKLRHVVISATLGSPGLEVPLPPTQDAGDDRAHWTNWYLRALVRQAGILPVRLSDRAVRQACRSLLDAWLITGQARYHLANAARSRAVHARASRWRDVAFVATVVLALMHLAHALLPFTHAAPRSLEAAIATFGIILPVIAAALHAFAHQLDFEGSARRSTRELRQLRDAWTETATPGELSSVELMRVLGLVSEGALGELVEWRSDLVSRPPTIP